MTTSRGHVVRNTLWVSPPSTAPHTTNGLESHHLHFNEQFYKAHPQVFTCIEILREIQVQNGVEMRANVDKKKREADLAIRDYAIYYSNVWSI